VVGRESVASMGPRVAAARGPRAGGLGATHRRMSQEGGTMDVAPSFFTKTWKQLEKGVTNKMH